MAVRIRRNVWSLEDDDTTLDWYRRAISVMFDRDDDDPASWRYQAAIHGVPNGMPRPPGTGPFWDQCQHQSWYFLPWHRGYLASFEAVVAKTIADLGGPADWALPYWDYSENLTVSPDARLMPTAFRDRAMPDGSFNHLWSRRVTARDGDFNLDDSVVTLEALQFDNFTNRTTTGLPSGFGGPETGFNPGGGGNGALENRPHNIIHVRIGGNGGFMSNPATAALDPIFWLHHCNIDRLWDHWRNRSAVHTNPPDIAWHASQDFNMHDEDGNPITFNCEAMLDTTAVLHGYRYDTVPVAVEPAEDGLEVMVASAREAEMVGASDTGLELGDDVTRARIAVRPATPDEEGLEGVGTGPQRAYLNLENITGVGVPGDFEVYVDLPDDDNESLPVGIMTTFGLDRASDPDRDHGGNGLTQVFEITDIARQLGLSSAGVADLQVTFIRVAPGVADEAVPPGLEAFAEAPQPHSIKVGRISLYYQ